MHTAQKSQQKKNENLLVATRFLAFGVMGFHHTSSGFIGGGCSAKATFRHT